MLNIVDRYLVGDMNSVFVGDTAYIDPGIKVIPYKYRRVKRHEIWHWLTCPFDLLNAPDSTRNKYENIADRGVAFENLPVARLMQLITSGIKTFEEIAEEVCLDVEFVERIFDMYQNIYGYNYRCGEYIIQSFVPFQFIKIEDAFNEVI